MMQPYRGKSQPPRVNNQVAVQNKNFNMFSHFDSIANQMMSHMDDQLAHMGFGSMLRNFNDFEEDLMGFSNLHNHIASMPMNMIQQNAQNGAFQVYSSSYVQTQKMGPDGKVIKEKYFDNNAVARGLNGHTISERQQGYKNSDGIDRFGHERMMNDKGRKFIKERDRTGQISTTNHYYNIDENQVQQFENDWLGVGRGIGFQNTDQYRNQMLGPSSGYQNQPIIAPRDGNQLPFPREQLGYMQSPPQKRKSDIQPIMLGNGASNQNVRPIMPQQSMQNVQRSAIDHPAIQHRVPNVASQTNPRAVRNAETNGIYLNRQAQKFAQPKAG